MGVFLGTTGCLKEVDENQQSNPAEQLEILPKNNIIAITPNANNPHDSLGIIHNILLEKLTTNYTYSSDTLIMEGQVKQNTGIEFSLYFPIDSMIDLDELNNIHSMEGLFSNLDFVNYDSLFHLASLDTAKASLIVDFIDECIRNESRFTNNNISGILNQIENDFINNRGGNFDEFYCTAAIFRYSLIYNYANNTQKLKSFWKLAIADAVGVTIGFAVGGGPLGALSGGAAASTIASHLWVNGEEG